MPVDYVALAAPFPPDEIEWRVGSTTQDKKKGMALAYIDARAVMDRLDAVVGPDGWQCRYPFANGKTCCEIGIKTVDCDADDEDHGMACYEWVWKADGAGDTDFEGAKGAFSDAFKRAAVRWGIGRYLYDMKAPWVEIEQKGKSYVIKKHELETLHRLAAGQSFTPSPPSNSHDPNWQGPMNKKDLADEMKDFFDKVKDCSDIDDFEALISEYDAVLSQCRHDMPGWMTGDNMSSDFVPADERIAAKRRFLTNQSKGEEF